MDLSKIEKKSWQTFFDDGLLDILLGLLLLNFGVAPVIERVFGIYYLYPYILGLFASEAIFFVAKKLLTAPRIGRVKFSKRRKQKKLKVSLVLTISVILGLAVYALFALEIVAVSAPFSWWVALFCINAIVVFSVMAYFLDVPRLYLYGLFFGFSIMLAEYLKGLIEGPYNALIGFGVFGVVILGIGVAFLVRFLQKYSLDEEGLYE